MSFWSTYYAMGIDLDTNKLVYSKKTETEDVWKTINLNTISDISVHNTDRRLKNKTTNKTETDKIELVLNSKDGAKINLEFYNIDINVEMTKEKALLEKWQPIIKNQLSKAKYVA